MIRVGINHKKKLKGYYKSMLILSMEIVKLQIYLDLARKKETHIRLLPFKGMELNIWMIKQTYS